MELLIINMYILCVYIYAKICQNHTLLLNIYFMLVPKYVKSVASSYARRKYCSSFFRDFAINRELPAQCQTMSAIDVAFLGRRRSAHFKINRKHWGKCRELSRADFSLRLSRQNGTFLSLSSRERSLLFVAHQDESRKYYPSRLIALHSEMTIYILSKDDDAPLFKNETNGRREEAREDFILFFHFNSRLIRVQ